MAIRLVSSNNLDLTLELAREFRDMAHTGTERPLDEKHVAHLRRKADEGHLVNFNWATAKLNGTLYRVNGQHSSKMLCDLPVDLFPKGLKVNQDEYEVDTPEDLVILFAQFDDPKSKRSTTDLAGVSKGQQQRIKDISTASIMLAIDGYDYWQAREQLNYKALKKDNPARYSVLNDQHILDFCAWFGEIYDKDKTPELKPKSVIAVMFGTFGKNAEEAKKFWKAVSIQDGEWGRALSKWILEAINEKMKEESIHQGCRDAWNGYRRAETVRPIKSAVIKKKFQPLVH